MCRFNKKHLSIAISVLGYMSSSYAEMYFPPEMLFIGNNQLADLALFKADGTQPADQYQVDIFLNGNYVNSKLLRFDAAEDVKNSGPYAIDIRDDTGLIPCLNRLDLKNIGIKVANYPELMNQSSEACISPGAYIPGAFTSFDFPKMRLDISAPQIAVNSNARGYIEPEYWDEGINAALMNYNFNAMRRLDGMSSDKNYYLNITSGLNIGSWRLRDQRNWNYSSTASGNQNSWQRMNTYAERTIIPWRSNLVIGEGTSGGDIFDALSFRGVSIATDDSMYPDSQRGYSPVVRGVASSNAEVTIRQNGYIIYKTSVAPGAFEITDLNPMHGNEDLEVSVTESGGIVRVFTVHYASVPQLLREGRVRYGVTAGQLRSSSNKYDNPSFGQGTITWGLSNHITAYGGFQGAHDYISAQGGVGVNMQKLGALSADITHANSTLVDGSKHHGQSLRFIFAHGFNPTGTNLRLTGYRFSTEGFHTLSETALKSMTGRLYPDELDEDGNPVKDNIFNYYNLYNTKKARVEANISQKLGDAGTLYVSGIRQTYWNTDAAHNSVQAGFSSRLGAVSYFLNYNYTKQKTMNAIRSEDHSVSLSFSVPLNKLLSVRGKEKHSVYANFQTTRDNSGDTSYQSGINGTLLEDENLAWNMSHGYSRHNKFGNAGFDYRGSYGNARAGYSYSGDYQRLSYGVSGGVILHRNGLTLGQPLSETSVLVATDGASNVGLLNEPGVSTDWRGYAIKPYANPYRENSVAIDVNKLNERTDIEGNVTNRVVPTKGAIVRTDYAVRQGYRTMIQILRNGKPLPFGTIATSGNSSGIVDDNGQVYLSGMQEKGSIYAKWGNSANEQCHAGYYMSTSDKDSSLVRLTATCQ